MDSYSKARQLIESLRNATSEVELVTTLTLPSGATQEITHTRRAVCKKAARQQNKTILTFVDIDRAALERVFPFETFTIADFPELFVDHVGWRVPQGVGTVTKVPLAWITKSGGTWKYAGPKLLGAANNAVLAVYRGTQEGKGSVVPPAEYTVGTAVGASTGVVVTTVNFTREQIDFEGRPYEIEADLALTSDPAIVGTSYRAPANEVARLLILFGIAYDVASFTDAATYDSATTEILVEALYGSRDKGKTGNAILEDLLAAGRSWLSPTATSAWAIVQDSPKASSAEFDTAADQITVEEYGDGDSPKTVSLTYRPRTSGLDDYAGLLSRTTTGASGELKLANPYIRSHVVADKILSYWQKRLSALRMARGVIHAAQVANGNAIEVTDNVLWTGAKTFIATGISRPADRNAVRLREYNADVYVYTAAPLPADATNIYSPDYSFTPPLVPTVLQVVSQGTSVATDGTLTAFALIRAVPPVVNWQRLIALVKDLTTNEVYQGQLLLAAGNYEAVIGGMRPGRNHEVRAWAVNSANLDGAVTAAVNFTSATSANAPGAPTLTAVQNSPRSIVVNWTIPSPGAGSPPMKEYLLHRKVGAGSFALFKTLDSQQYIDDEVNIGTAYEYKVQGRNRIELDGADSNSVSVTLVKLISDSLISSQGVGPNSIANSSINQARTFSSTQSQSGNITAGNVVSVGGGSSTDYSFAPGLTLGSSGSVLGTIALLLTPSSTQFIYYLQNNDASTQPYDADWRQVGS